MGLLTTYINIKELGTTDLIFSNELHCIRKLVRFFMRNCLPEVEHCSLFLFSQKQQNMIIWSVCHVCLPCGSGSSLNELHWCEYCDSYKLQILPEDGALQQRLSVGDAVVQNTRVAVYLKYLYD